MMKKIYNNHLFLLTYLIMSIGILITSCEKDNDENSGSVELLSFGPCGVKHGEQIKFIGKNLDQVLAIKLVGDSVRKTSFVEQSDELIVIIVPETAESGYVTLVTSNGNIVSKTRLDFDVTVTITSVPSGARPGDNITITGQYLNWVKEITFAKDIIVSNSDFVSKSLTEIVVAIPVNARTGTLTFTTGGTDPMSIATDNDLVVTLPAISGFTPNPVERGANLTITGTDLDLTMGILFKGVSDTIKDFVSQSATELVVTVPEGTNKGKITLLPYSLVPVESADKLTLVGDLPDLDPLAYIFYDDALENGWGNWGWGNTADLANTENVRDGEASIKIIFTGSWGALYFGGGSVSTAGYTELVFSIYGESGADGSTLNISANWGQTYAVTIKEGQWVEYKVTMADMGSPATITDLVFQETGWSGTIYIDHVGFR